MKIKSIKLTNFKRFTKLNIKEIPETAKLVVMIGPNGCGKSSVFDALKLYFYSSYVRDDLTLPDYYYQNVDYYIKSNQSRYGLSYHKHSHQSLSQRMDSYEFAVAYSLPPGSDNYALDVEFHREEVFQRPYVLDKSVHVRTAYRNSPAALPHIINRIHPREERGLFSLIENDEVFASNYWKLVLQWLERSSEIGEHEENLANIQSETLDKLRDAISRLFTDPQLVLKNLGNPLDGDLFQFDKGTSERFSFQNLASGEKAAIDLLLDVIVTKAEYDETIICIDEPEAHIHTKLQGQLLAELYNIVSDKSQLWIATHSIGMVRKAQDLWRENPDSVVFLDFGREDLDFDGEATIIPDDPNPDLWERIYDIALGDLAELVASEQYIFCEGEGFDETCYRRIFASRYPETRFISVGGSSTVKNVVKALRGEFVKGAKVIGVVDRNGTTKEGIRRNAEKGIQTLEWGEIEDYLLHNEVLTQLCESQGQSDKVQEFLGVKDEAVEEVNNNNRIKDKQKSIFQRIQQQAEEILGLSYSGDTVDSFKSDILAPLIKPDMTVYKQLHKDIFGDLSR